MRPLAMHPPRAAVPRVHPTSPRHHRHRQRRRRRGRGRTAHSAIVRLRACPRSPNSDFTCPQRNGEVTRCTRRGRRCKRTAPLLQLQTETGSRRPPPKRRARMPSTASSAATASSCAAPPSPQGNGAPSPLRIRRRLTRPQSEGNTRTYRTALFANGKQFLLSCIRETTADSLSFPWQAQRSSRTERLPARHGSRHRLQRRNEVDSTRRAFANSLASSAAEGQRADEAESSLR